MALFGPSERRTPTARIVHGTIYLILTIGSLTMVYPFLLMLGASVTTELDFEDWRIVPEYLSDDVALFRKWLDDRYDIDFVVARRVHRLEVANLRFLESIPDVDVTDPSVRRCVADWFACMETVPDILLRAFHRNEKRTRTTHQKFAAWLAEHHDNDVAAFNRKFGGAYQTFLEVFPYEAALTHKLRMNDAPLRAEYIAFRKTLPPDDMMAVLATDGFALYLERHVGTIEKFNKRFGTSHESMSDVVFPIERPTKAGPWRDLWDLYVAKRFPLLAVRVEGDFDEAYRRFLKESHHDYDRKVSEYNAEHGTAFPTLAAVRYPATMPDDDLRFADWVRFTDHHVPPQAKRLTTVEGIWRDWLGAEYGLLSEVNRAHGAAWKDWSRVVPPRAEADIVTFYANRDGIRSEFFWRNYRLVLDYILFHGRAVLNTLILVVMTVLGHLTVQPLAAYGLSRFRLRYAHKILLFLLATMAFPAEVAMIPNFLLIKELGLLNTYWALVLPGLASGMGIFLLKGYFDSLPQELYEAAMIDGASELRMFAQITLPLSKPILAVIALTSFVAAYGGFMWAFLICQLPHMWTLMVFLWQLGHESYQSVWMAGLVIAAIPTLLVFIFCQNIILRGIIVPTMK